MLQGAEEKHRQQEEKRARPGELSDQSVQTDQSGRADHRRCGETEAGGTLPCEDGQMLSNSPGDRFDQSADDEGEVLQEREVLQAGEGDQFK